MSLETAVANIELALRSSCGCSAGLTAQMRVFGVPHGPSGGPELLALMYADDPLIGYWYGHVLADPGNAQQFVAVIVWSERLVNANTVPLLFRRFHYWIKDRLQYQPCSVQNSDDAYCEAPSLEAAASALAIMIRRFDLEKRLGHEDGPYAISPPELRILKVYGLADTQDAQGCYPPVPMPTPITLASVTGRR